MGRLIRRVDKGHFNDMMLAVAIRSESSLFLTTVARILLDRISIGGEDEKPTIIDNGFF